LPVGFLVFRRVRTVEGRGTKEAHRAMQRAFIEEQAAQCGYCIAGMIMRAQGLLEHNRTPSDEDIRRYMAFNLCRCGTHMRILRAVRRAAKAIALIQSTSREALK
jgi:aerobic-type carbon monoxide dehydrogenase small subunit (CoxS/CutS family)